MKELAVLFFASIITNNIVLYYFLGICPFIAMSNEMSASAGMCFAVTFVMILSTALIWPINHYLLIPYNAEYLQLILYILIIAVSVQILELIIDRHFPVLYNIMGIFLPLITVNCAILGIMLFLTLRKYTFIESIIFSAGSGLGWGFASITLSAIRSKLRFANIPEPLKGIGITLIIASFMAMGFMGFAGWINLQGN